jgi:serine/threonine protein kinase
MNQIDYKKKYLKYKKKYLELKNGGVLTNDGNITIITDPKKIKLRKEDINQKSPKRKRLDSNKVQNIKENINPNSPNRNKSTKHQDKRLKMIDQQLKIKIPEKKNNQKSEIVEFYENEKKNNRLKFLGKGSYGSVYEINFNNKNLVVKEIKKNPYDCNQLKKIKEESNILFKIKYPFITYSEYEFEELNDKYLIFMNNIEGKELFDYLYTENNYSKYNKKISKILPLALQMIILNYYIHSNGLTHFDLKPENYMIEENGLVHLIDFGLSKCLKKSNICDYESNLIDRSTGIKYNESINQLIGTPSLIGLSMASKTDRHLSSYIDDYYTLSLIILSLYDYDIAIKINNEFTLINFRNKEFRKSILNEFKTYYNSLKKNSKYYFYNPNEQNQYTKEEVIEYESISKLISHFLTSQEENYNQFINISKDKSSDAYKNYHKHNVLNFMSIFEKYYSKDITNDLIKIMKTIDMFHKGNYSMNKKKKFLVDSFNRINNLIIK